MPNSFWIGRRQEFLAGRTKHRFVRAYVRRRTCGLTSLSAQLDGANPKWASLRTAGMKIATTLLATCVLTLTACGSNNSSATTDATPAVTAPVDEVSEMRLVEITMSRFGTPELTVPAGTTVRFVNRDPYAHTVTSKAGSAMTFDSGELLLADTFDVTFDEVGEFAYFCQIHPTMRGVVIVE